MAELRQVADKLEGQLTATLLMDEGDIEAAQALLPVLERKVGRILANGYPTGVEVCSAMVHGGPFPSTSRWPYHLGRHGRDHAFPASGVLPEPVASLAAGSPAR